MQVHALHACDDLSYFACKTVWAMITKNVNIGIFY